MYFLSQAFISDMFYRKSGWELRHVWTCSTRHTRDADAWIRLIRLNLIGTFCLDVMCVFVTIWVRGLWVLTVSCVVVDAAVMLCTVAWSVWTEEAPLRQRTGSPFCFDAGAALLTNTLLARKWFLSVSMVMGCGCLPLFLGRWSRSAVGTEDAGIPGCAHALYAVTQCQGHWLCVRVLLWWGLPVHQLNRCANTSLQRWVGAMGEWPPQRRGFSYKNLWSFSYGHI